MVPVMPTSVFVTKILVKSIELLIRLKNTLQLFSPGLFAVHKTMCTKSIYICYSDGGGVGTLSLYDDPCNIIGKISQFKLWPHINSTPQRTRQ
jgi:hypothetical protein